MAERIAPLHASRLGVDNLTAASAGTQAVIGHSIHPKATAVLQRVGADSSSFAARQISAKIVATADLVLGMTKAHRDAVLAISPQKFKVTYTLAEAASLVTDFGADSIESLAEKRPLLSLGEGTDIDDPIRGDEERFSAVGDLISQLLVPVIDICRPAR